MSSFVFDSRRIFCSLAKSKVVLRLGAGEGGGYGMGGGWQYKHKQCHLLEKFRLLSVAVFFTVKTINAKLHVMYTRIFFFFKNVKYLQVLLFM